MIFGPWSHTFQAYKLENLMKMSMKSEDVDNSQCEFYGWECISVKLKERTIDFVVSDPTTIVKLLITLDYLIKMHVLNGNTPSFDLTK